LNRCKEILAIKVIERVGLDMKGHQEVHLSSIVLIELF